MKRLFLFALTVLIFSGLTTTNSQSKGFGPDEMKTYFMVMLIKSDSHDMKSEASKNLQKEHISYITAFYETGELVMAGPVLANKDFSEILFFDVETRMDAEKILNADPAVSSGSFTYRILTWLGPKAIKTNFSKEK